MATTITERMQRLETLLARVSPVPADWLDAKANPAGGCERMRPIECRSWELLEAEWRDKMRWRQSMSDVFSTMLAVAASTSQTGNQLCLMVIADPGSGKSEMCDAMLTSDQCYQLEHMTGFHSGYKGEDGKDFSLLSRINHKTLITSEGDVLFSSPFFAEVMSQMRRIYDGRSSANYKNLDEAKSWDGLRTPWIIAGPPIMLSKDESRHGDRFLRVHLDQPVISERQQIVLAAMRAERAAVREASNGTAGGLESRMRRAYGLTGGYVDWLRENITNELALIDVDDNSMLYIKDLAEMIADMRARPNPDNKHENNDSKELPSRLGRQLMRLAECLAVVLNRPRVDGEVLRRVRRVALDSARGRSLEVASLFFRTDPRTGQPFQSGDGLMMSLLSRWGGLQEDRMQAYLTFLAKIGVVQHSAAQNTHGYWKLTPRSEQLYITTCLGT